MENVCLLFYTIIGIVIVTKYFIKRTEDVQALKSKRLNGGTFKDFFFSPKDYISDYVVIYLLITCFLLMIKK